MTTRQQLAEDPQAQRATTVFLVGLGTICAVTTLIGAVPTRMFGHDTFIPLEMGWRILNGQRPHVDFVSGWGPVWFLLEALGLRIAKCSVNGIGYANALMALLVGGWSFALGKHRLLPWPRTIYSLFLAALVTSPYALGYSPLMSSHAMVYNRWGYALIGLVLLECLAPLAGNRDDLAGGVSTGAALGLALFLKVSFFLVAGVMVVALAVLHAQLGRRRLLGMAVGFATLSLALLAYLRFDLVAMLRDLHMAGAARSTLFTSEAIVNKVMSHPSELLGVLLFAWTGALVLGEDLRTFRGWRLPLIGVLVFGGDFALMMTNQQWDGFPLCACFGILIANQVWQKEAQPANSPASFPMYAGALSLAALLVIPQFTSDIVGLGYGLWSKETAASADMVRFTAPRLAPLVLYDGYIERSNGRVLTTYVNDGVALLERASGPQDRILSLDMTNVFPFALARPPAHGGVASPTYHFNMDDDNRPPDDEFFGDADIVMVPKHPALDDYYYKDFLRTYQPAIESRYWLAAESSWWWMYRRKH